MPDAPIVLGHVVAVHGSTITGVLAADAGEGADFGGLVKLMRPASEICGVVSGLWVEGAASADGKAARMMRIELSGELTGGGERRFQRGVSSYPRLGEPILGVEAGDLEVIYARPAASSVRIGSIREAPGLSCYVATDALLGKHFAVLGTTGTGKSCALALILRAILGRHPNGHIVILDPHNEYGRAFGAMGERISPANLRLPYWMMNGDELTALFVQGQGADQAAETDILKRAVLDARRRFAGDGTDPATITVDTPLPFRLGDLERSLIHGMGKLTKADSSQPYLRLQGRLEQLTSDGRYAFLLEGLLVKDTMADVLSRLVRVPVDGRPVTILDLSGVPSEIVDAVVSLICRMLFDFVLWSAEPQAVPVLLVCEEAHRYVPADERQGYRLSRRGVARIAKEGRKYGLSLALVSQRPSELATSILSQCNTIFALRLSNERDQEFVRNALPEGAAGLLAALPALHNREAIVVGEAVSLPLRLAFEDVADGCRPRSATASFSQAWEYDSCDRAFLEETIDRWRRQDRDDGE